MTDVFNKPPIFSRYLMESIPLYSLVCKYAFSELIRKLCRRGSKTRHDTTLHQTNVS